MTTLGILLFGYLCMVLGHSVQAAPRLNTHCGASSSTSASIAKWKFPCGMPDSSVTVSPMPVDIATALHVLLESATHFRNVVTDMKAKYTPPGGTRVTGTDLIQSLQAYDIPGLDLPQEGLNITNVTRVFLEDYGSLSRLAVFLEQILMDEINCEFGAYIKGMNTVENATLLILCNLHTAIHSAVNATIPYYVERDVMSEVWRTMDNSASRFMRDYVVFHNAENFGKLLIEKYKLLSFHRMIIS